MAVGHLRLAIIWNFYNAIQQLKKSRNAENTTIITLPNNYTQNVKNVYFFVFISEYVVYTGHIVRKHKHVSIYFITNGSGTAIDMNGFIKNR